uniref:Uncharacterized protein n=1 Tax=Anguilla anguilla TaxID=7936 RepID=A0A0E9U060_ANGAN
MTVETNLEGAMSIFPTF